MDSDDVHNDFISVQLVQDQSNEKGYSRITGLERLIFKKFIDTTDGFY